MYRIATVQQYVPGIDRLACRVIERLDKTADIMTEFKVRRSPISYTKGLTADLMIARIALEEIDCIAATGKEESKELLQLPFCSCTQTVIG